MAANPLALDWMLHNGVDQNTGRQIGPQTGDLESFKSFDEVMDAYKKQLKAGMTLEVESRNLWWQATRDIFPDAWAASLFTGGIQLGKTTADRPLPYKLGFSMNICGTINMADSLAAIKKVVFDDKKYTMKQLKDALAANWQGNGYAEMRKVFLAAPKYGNDNDYVDLIAKDIYKFYADTAVTFDNPRGGKFNPAAISISAHAPAGMLCGATPEGRYAHEIFADGSMSPAQGRDINGPTAVMKSAAKIDQARYLATLMNMKLHPSSFKTTEDKRKLAALIKTYFSMGGKHVQFNVATKETLVDAQKSPEKHRDLLVRVAGYSAYFVQLSPGVQNEVICRTEHELRA